VRVSATAKYLRGSTRKARLITEGEMAAEAAISELLEKLDGTPARAK